MSILIKGMEMPKRCADCWLMDGEDKWCCACHGKPLSADYRYGIKERPSWCPLIELPPHGDLIERSAAYDKIAEQEGGYYIDMDAVGMGLDETPTIIEAEGVRE